MVTLYAFKHQTSKLKPNMGTRFTWLFLNFVAVCVCKDITSAQRISGLETDLDKILQNVDEVQCGGCAPGMIAVFGDNAVTILAGYSRGHDVHIPFGAAARLGDGRIVAFGHTGRPLDDPHQITLNSIFWAGQQTSPDLTKVGVVKAPPLVEFLNQNSFIAESITEQDLEDPSLLSQYNVIVIRHMHGVKLNEDSVSTLKSYIKSGGGFVAACTPWAIETSFDWFGNQIIRESGIIWVPKNMNANYNSTNFEISKELLPNLQCPYAAEQIISILNGKRKLDVSETILFQRTVAFCLENVPLSYLPWLPGLKDTILEQTPTIPLMNPTEFQRAQANLEVQLRNYLEETQTPHASTEIFPGLVEDVEVETITIANVKLRTGQKRFHTGQYAPPGAQIKVEISGARWFSIRIGCHSDNLIKKDQWSRFPVISNRKPVNGSIGYVSSGFGGIIYIESIQLYSENSTLFTVKIDGSIKTPTFIVDRTQNWEEVRKLKAPFAEIVGRQVSLSLPGHVASSINDPLSLANFWDSVLDSMSDLAGVSYDENFQQFVFDLDISAGYMHSGFPIMAYLRSAPVASNLSVLMFNKTVDDVWGFFHELGHNHQKGEWTFEGGGEVTCNIFAMYVINILLGRPLAETRPHLFSPENIQAKLKPFIENGCNYFDDFVSSESVKHLFYYQLVICHGWESYKKTFRAYSKLTGDEIPVDYSPDAKRDKWLIIFSQSSGYNIGPLMRSWGIPITEAAEEEVNHLPASQCKITDLLN